MLSINKLLVQTLRKNKTQKIPFWLMRQAGRYLPEYREVRAKAGSFLSLCYDPKLACEVTLQPLRRFHFDAAILFSDILVIPDALGMDVRFEEGEGPVLSPIKTAKDIEKLKISHLPSHLAPVYEAVGRIKENLPETTTLIGFSGSPWTLATYMLEGKSSKDFAQAKTFAMSSPLMINDLLDILTEAVIAHCFHQIEAGAEVIQLFDSWAGIVPERFINEWVINPTKHIVSTLKQHFPEVPVIGFPRNIGVHYQRYALETGVDGVSLDWQIPLDWVQKTLQPHVAVQGNLDPVFLLGDKNILEKEIIRILDKLSDNPFIFNLGHGILPSTPIENVELLVKTIRNYR